MTSARTALLLHGINGDSDSLWLFAEALGIAGWSVTAPDLLGHGDAPRPDSYRFDDYATDLPAGPWDLVVAHSLGGAIAVVASSVDPAFARRMVLIDPALLINESDRAGIRDDQLAELTQTLTDIETAHPRWDPRDHRAKAFAASRADREMVVRTFAQNTPWDVAAQAARVTVPTLIIGGDPSNYSVLDPVAISRMTEANPLLAYVIVRGSGHAPHRDDPSATLAAMTYWLTGSASLDAASAGD